MSGISQMLASLFHLGQPAHPSKNECTREDKEVRENMTEKQIDKTLADTFPASDPPAWY